MTQPILSHEEKAARSRERQAALRELDRNRRKLMAALVRMENRTVADVLRKAQKLTS